MEPKGVFPEKHTIPGKVTESVFFIVFQNFAEKFTENRKSVGKLQDNCRKFALGTSPAQFSRIFLAILADKLCKFPATF